MAGLRPPPPPPPVADVHAARRRVPPWFGTAVFLVMLAAWIVWLRPASLGGPITHVIVSGESMEPTLYQGDLVVVRKQSTYKIGDVVAFKVPEGEPGGGAIVIHRIIEADGNEYVLQGDNKPIPDLWHPTDEDVLGKMWVHADGVGAFVAQGRSPLWLAIFASGVAFILVITAPLPKGREEATA